MPGEKSGSSRPAVSWLSLTRCCTVGGNRADQRTHTEPDDEEGDGDEGERVDDAGRIAAQHFHNARPAYGFIKQLRFEEVHSGERHHIAAIGRNAGRRGYDLLHLGEIGVDLGLIGGFADHLGDATLVDDHGNRNLLDGIAVLDSGDRLGIDLVVGLLFLLGRLVGRLRATAAALGRCLRYVLLHGCGRIRLRFLGFLVFLHRADGALDA